jgi:hypothetical protein
MRMRLLSVAWNICSVREYLAAVSCARGLVVASSEMDRRGSSVFLKFSRRVINYLVVRMQRYCIRPVTLCSVIRLTLSGFIRHRRVKAPPALLCLF